MTRAFVALMLLLFLSIGTIFSPVGNFSCADYVPEVYTRCIAEDPEIEWADFVFEHLLCLESLVEFIEQEQEDNDPAGAPYQLPQTVVQSVVTIVPVFQLAVKNTFVINSQTHFSQYSNPFTPGDYVHGVFRPPAA